MRIIDNKPFVLVTKYEVGDVIQDSQNIFMVITSEDGRFMLVDLKNGQGTNLYDSIEGLYDNEHMGGEHLVEASVMIDGNAV